MPALSQVLTDLNTVKTDIWDGTNYTSVTPAQINTDSPTGLQQAAIDCWQALTNLLHDSGIAINWPGKLPHKA